MTSNSEEEGGARAKYVKQPAGHTFLAHLITRIEPRALTVYLYGLTPLMSILKNNSSGFSTDTLGPVDMTASLSENRKVLLHFGPVYMIMTT